MAAPHCDAVELKGSERECGTETARTDGREKGSWQRDLSGGDGWDDQSEKKEKEKEKRGCCGRRNQQIDKKNSDEEYGDKQTDDARKKDGGC